MCWFSAEYANHVADANAGERLGVKKMYGDNSWVVSECEIEARRPTPVCLLDRTKVLFRFSESQERWWQFGAEAEAVFRMLKQPHRDVFEFVNGEQIPIDALPHGVIFDVLVVPGSEEDSRLLTAEPAIEHEGDKEKASFFDRLLARL